MDGQSEGRDTAVSATWGSAWPDRVEKNGEGWSEESHQMSAMGPFKCCVTRMGVGVSNFPEKKRYEGVRFNVISVTRRWVGVQFPGKKRYVTPEWPLWQSGYLWNILFTAPGIKVIVKTNLLWSPVYNECDVSTRILPSVSGSSQGPPMRDQGS